MKKTAFPVLVFIPVLMAAACGGGGEKPDSSPDGPGTDTVQVHTFSCTGPDTTILYQTDTVENDMVITYPGDAGYELSASATAPGAYELYGEWDKDEQNLVEFFCIGMPKVDSLDEKQHLDQELAAARSQPGFALFEEGKLEGVLYSTRYAFTSMKKNDRVFNGIVLLHFDPLLRNYYYVMVQSTDLEHYRKDVCTFFPFIRDLRFIKKR